MSTVAEPLTRFSVHKRHVNDYMHDSLAAHLEFERIAFFCECLKPRCFETVWLTAGEYEAGCSNPRWYVRVPGH